MENLVNEYHQATLPSGYERVELDMGCGRGGFTRQLAERFPERLVVASDVMVGRLRIVESRLRRAKLSNVCVLRAEHGMLAEFQLPLSSIDRIHLLCPDPWPKDLPRKSRRIASTAFFCLLPRVLKRGGVFHFASDDAPYFEDVRRVALRLPFFTEDTGALSDVEDMKTDFEMQWEAEGKVVRHLAMRYGMNNQRG